MARAPDLEMTTQAHAALSPAHKMAPPRLCEQPKYNIRSDLLYELLTYGDGTPSRLGLGSNWNVDHGAARPLLTLVAMMAFGIVRLPGRHDRCFARDLCDERARAALARIDRAMLEEAAHDARALHAHTQRVLAGQGLAAVRLHRSLHNVGEGRWGERLDAGYASFVSQVDDAALRLGRTSFCIPMDILSSWCVGPYGLFQVVMEVDVPIENIAWCSALIASRAGNPDAPALEAGEWVVLNRSLDGVVSLPAGCVVHRPEVERSTRGDPWRARGDDEDLAELVDRSAPAFEGVACSRRLGTWPSPQRLGWRARLGRSWRLLFEPRVV